MNGWHYIKQDLVCDGIWFAFFVGKGLSQFERLLAAHARFQQLHGD